MYSSLTCFADVWCVYVRNIYVRADNLTALTVTEALWECIIVLWRTWEILVARRTESVIATGHELSVEVSSKEPARNTQSFFVHVSSLRNSIIFYAAECVACSRATKQEMSGMSRMTIRMLASCAKRNKSTVFVTNNTTTRIQPEHSRLWWDSSLRVRWGVRHDCIDVFRNWVYFYHLLQSANRSRCYLQVSGNGVQQWLWTDRYC